MAQFGPEAAEAVTRRAAAFCDYYQVPLRTEANALLGEELTPREYYERLRGHGCLREARHVLAHLLPRRRALWWSAVCVHESCRPEAGPLAEAIQALVRYCVEPSEAHRRAADAVGRAAQRDGLARVLSSAVFQTEGSLAPPGYRLVPPEPYVAGRLVSVAVYLAAVRRSSARYKDHLDRYLQIGLDLLQGPDPWEGDQRPSLQAKPLSAAPTQTERVADRPAKWTGA